MRIILPSLAMLAAAACTAVLPPAPLSPAPVPPALAAAASTEPAVATPAASAEQDGFVIAANPLAARAGEEVLRRGGSAIDAAVAVQAMLGLVEPQSSGIGGGAFLTYYDAATGKVTVYDGREVAPAGANPGMFLGNDGQPLSFATAVLSGRSAGVPGAVATLATAHARLGKLAWSSLFGAAERAAAEGFIVSPRLDKLVHGHFVESNAPDVIRYFSQGPGGALVRAGDRLRNPAYAEFLARLAAQGPDALYKGQTAARIVETLRQGDLPSSMTTADLAAYKPVVRDALCRPWQGYELCTPPPPSSGVGLIELLQMLEHTDIASRSARDPQAWFLFAEASRLMYADRDRYVGDPAFVGVPVAGLLDPAYVARRAALIGTVPATVQPAPGTPPGALARAADHTLEPGGTSHFVIRDPAGNVVSMTTTVESIFGDGRMVDGFFLNNQLTDFSFSPTMADGTPAANAVAPLKKPRSSMVPSILLTPDGRFAGAIGSAGGNSILAYVAKSLVAAVMWHEPMQQAIAEPNLIARGIVYQGEVTKFAPGVLESLAARGIQVKPGEGEDSGIQGVLLRDGGRIDGGYDPRREGTVILVPPPR